MPKKYTTSKATGSKTPAAAAKGATAKKAGPAAAGSDKATEDTKPASKGAEAAPEEDVTMLEISLKQLSLVVLDDDDKKLQASGKWPLIVDESEKAGTFLKYRDVNYINVLSPEQMDIESIRRSLLGSIRFGKPFVLDMMDVDMFDLCSDRLNEIQPGLMASLLDKSLIKEEKYEGLIRKSDGDEYEINKFSEFFTDNFQFIVITKNPSKELLKQTYPIKIQPLP